MKAILLFLFISLTGSTLAQTSSSYSPDSLKTGDWLTIEAVHYYPYIAPGIKEELPWRAENIRRVIFRATVTDKGSYYPGFVKRGQTAYPGNQRFSDRMEKGRDYPASTKYMDYRCLICAFSEYGIYLLLFRPWNNSQGLDCP